MSTMTAAPTAEDRDPIAGARTSTSTEVQPAGPTRSSARNRAKASARARAASPRTVTSASASAPAPASAPASTTATVTAGTSRTSGRGGKGKAKGTKAFKGSRSRKRAGGGVHGEVDLIAEEEEGEEEGDEEGDDYGEYCICRKGDDGTPMVWCQECHEWYHFKCIGLTKKAAEQLGEYRCSSCVEKTGRTSKSIAEVAQEKAEARRSGASINDNENDDDPSSKAEGSATSDEDDDDDEDEDAEDEEDESMSNGDDYNQADGDGDGDGDGDAQSGDHEEGDEEDEKMLVGDKGTGRSRRPKAVPAPARRASTQTGQAGRRISSSSSSAAASSSAAGSKRKAEKVAAEESARLIKKGKQSASGKSPRLNSSTDVALGAGAGAGTGAASGGQPGVQVPDARQDPVRKHALAQFTSVLERIFRETETESSFVNDATGSADADAGAAADGGADGEGTSERPDATQPQTQTQTQPPPEEAASTYAALLEAELFALYPGRPGLTAPSPPPASKGGGGGGGGTGSAVSQLYKDRFRTLLFNLKDKANKALHTRIASGTITPPALARLSNEELANDDLRREVEAAKRDALEQSVMKKQAGAPLRKMTHKGEVDIETDQWLTDSTEEKSSSLSLREEAAVLLLQQQQQQQQQRSHPLQSPGLNSSAKLESPSAARRLGDMAPPSASPTVRQRESESPVRFVDMTTRRSPSTPVVVDDHSDQSIRPAGAGIEHTGIDPVLQSPTTSTAANFDLSNLWSAQAGTNRAEGDAENDATMDSKKAKPDENEEEDDEEPYEPQEDEDMREGEENADADDFIDSFLGVSSSEAAAPAGEKEEKSAGAAAAAAATEAQPPEASGDENSGKAAPVADQDHPEPSGPRMQDLPVIWKGAITMPDEATFSGEFRQIAGRPLGTESETWAYFFPSTYSIIGGRLPTKAASDYLIQSRLAPRTELIVLAMEPVFEPSALALAGDVAPMSETGNKDSFAKMLAYFHGRQRYGVLPSALQAQGRIVKDFYLAPLRAQDRVPEWLELLDTSAFDDAVEKREKDMLLAVAVLFKGSLEADLVKKKRMQDSAMGAQEEYNPTRKLDLGALGGTGSPFGAGASGTPPHLPFSMPPTTTSAPSSTPALALPDSNALSNLLSAGPSTLQGLLRSVGGGAPADPALAALPPSGGAPTSTPAPLEGNQMAAPTATALAQLPAPKLEAMLHSNPALVDQLLSSLNVGQQHQQQRQQQQQQQEQQQEQQHYRPPAPGPGPGPSDYSLNRPARPGPPGPPPPPPPARPAAFADLHHSIPGAALGHPGHPPSHSPTAYSHGAWSPPGPRLPLPPHQGQPHAPVSGWQSPPRRPPGDSAHGHGPFDAPSYGAPQWRGGPRPQEQRSAGWAQEAPGAPAAGHWHGRPGPEVAPVRGGPNRGGGRGAWRGSARGSGTDGGWRGRGRGR